MQRRLLRSTLLGFSLLCLIAGLIALLALDQPLRWYFNRAWVEAYRFFNPPEKIIFTPQGGGEQMVIHTIVAATLAVLFSPTAAQVMMTPSTTPVPSETIAPPSPTATLIHSPTPSATPIPTRVVLNGIIHEYQQFNNCAPANLAMALSFWGWEGDQNDTRAYLRPNRQVDDKNVMPAEMVDYVEKFTPFRALWRLAGDVPLLKRLIAASMPVIIEKGLDPSHDWWLGHYLVLSGYDDEQGIFITQDSLVSPNLPLPYEEIQQQWWQDFNYVYILIYPPEKATEVAALLGANMDVRENQRLAAERAMTDIARAQGRDLLFAWFNLGASLTGLEDYPAAAQAFDQAFTIYRNLPEEERPYRLMWYRVEPYVAYYYTGRYQDVIQLANATFMWVGQAVLEESYYWRGMAYQALGETHQAISDFQKAVALNPNFTAAQQALQDLEANSP